MKLNESLDKNIALLKNLVCGGDIIYFEFTINKTLATIVYADCLADKEMIGKQVISPLSSYDKEISAKGILKSLTFPEGQILQNIEKCSQQIVNGDAVILIDGLQKAISIACKKPAARTVAEPPTSSILKGPREGFVENILTNMNLIRQRLRSPDLCFDKFTVGKYSQTTVGVVYISSIANSKIVEMVKSKIEKISIDGVVDSSYIIKMISTKKTSLFKQVGTTEKPDILVAKLLEGRIGIVVDGSPIILTVPFLFVEDFQSSEDYYINNYRANISRIIRLGAVLFAIYLPAFFVAAQLFHLQLIPLNFLLTIVGSIKGIPLSPSVEMFFTLFIFETLNEASIRMPRYVGIAMSVVGALVLGETAVNAGIVSTPTIMIVALSGICIYTVPDMTETLSVLRLLFLIIGGSFGGYGIILASVALLTYLSAFDSFTVPYLSPYSPLILNDLQDGFTIDFLANTKKRPLSFKSPNKTRKGDIWIK